ncbi:hypothetical protein L204_101268 [Cryptococcus depauperatus]
MPPPPPAIDTATSAPPARRNRRVTILSPTTSSVLADLRSELSAAPITAPEANLAGSPSHASHSGPGRRRAHTISVSIPNTRPNSNGLASRLLLKKQRSTDVEQGLGESSGHPLPSSTAYSSDIGGHGSQKQGQRRSRKESSPVIFDLPLPHHDDEEGDGFHQNEPAEGHGKRELGDDMVGVLDVIDPHVSTVNHLQNMCNSVMVPYIPGLWTRRPEVELPETSSDESLALLQGQSSGSYPPTSRFRSSSRLRQSSISLAKYIPGRRNSVKNHVNGVTRDSELYRNNGLPFSAPVVPADDWRGARPLAIPEKPDSTEPHVRTDLSKDSNTLERIESDPVLSKRQVEGIAEEPGSTTIINLSEKNISTPLSRTSSASLSADIISIQKSTPLDKHVKHVLSSSSRQKLLRVLSGLWAFVKTPMGFITAVYGFCVVFWGAAIVLFLLGWIHTGSKYRKNVWVEISSQVENGLFTITGVGLIPWRAVDTYRMSVIWTLKKRAERRRAKMGLPPVPDENDLPDPDTIPGYIHVLNSEETERLRRHQENFALSQTWYKPHATATHKAFPMKYALWNTIFMDLNSFFQCLLCGCMWGMNWHVRPAWTTGSLIPLSFLCGIGAAVLIYFGSVKTKKQQAVSDKLRYALGVGLVVGHPQVGLDIANMQTTRDGGVVVGIDHYDEDCVGNNRTGQKNKDDEGRAEDPENFENKISESQEALKTAPLRNLNQNVMPGHPHRRKTVTFGPSSSRHDFSLGQSQDDVQLNEKEREDQHHNRNRSKTLTVTTTNSMEKPWQIK